MKKETEIKAMIKSYEDELAKLKRQQATSIMPELFDADIRTYTKIIEWLEWVLI